MSYDYYHRVRNNRGHEWTRMAVKAKRKRYLVFRGYYIAFKCFYFIYCPGCRNVIVIIHSETAPDLGPSMAFQLRRNIQM